jgi:hypothetical protein
VGNIRRIEEVHREFKGVVEFSSVGSQSSSSAVSSRKKMTDSDLRTVVTSCIKVH